MYAVSKLVYSKDKEGAPQPNANTCSDQNAGWFKMHGSKDEEQPT